MCEYPNSDWKNASTFFHMSCSDRQNKSKYSFLNRHYDKIGSYFVTSMCDMFPLIYTASKTIVVSNYIFWFFIEIDLSVQVEMLTNYHNSRWQIILQPSGFDTVEIGTSLFQCRHQLFLNHNFLQMREKINVHKPLSRINFHFVTPILASMSARLLPSPNVCDQMNVSKESRRIHDWESK